MPEHLFVYFKTPVAVREQAQALIIGLSAELGDGLTTAIMCSRRADSTPANASDSFDTWLEHYQCRNSTDANSLLKRLAQVDVDHPLLKLTLNGPAGRHVENFICV